MRRVATALLAAGLLAACPAGADLPRTRSLPAGGDQADGVQPDGCGDYAQTDLGAKIKRFLTATVELDRVVHDTERYVLETCRTVGSELALSGLGDDTRAACDAVAAELRTRLRASIQPEARLDVAYEPAACTVDASLAASAAAACEANASAEVPVTCTGICEGTCRGHCDGACGGGSGAECAGACDGGCQGSCEGRCRGTADVDASAACRANAAIAANLAATCEPAELTVGYDAAVVTDAAKLAGAVAAIKLGVPRLLTVHAKLTGPVRVAFDAWAASAQELQDTSSGDVAELGAEVACVTGQLAAALGMLAGIQASVEVSVSVSVEVSGSAGASV